MIIPARNAGDLQLAPDVVKACEEGKFHVHAVNSVEDGIEILTGVPAGVRDENGNYPVDSIFGARNGVCRPKFSATTVTKG